jgi:hypothetical protein
MPLLSILPPIHLLAYSTLLGTELYQSFMMTKISYQALPRAAFTTLQKRVFPVYFQSQSLLILLVTLTSPPHRPSAVMQDKCAWLPLLIAAMTAGLNLVVYGPRTQDLMVQRVHRGWFRRLARRCLSADEVHSDARCNAARREGRCERGNEITKPGLLQGACDEYSLEFDDNWSDALVRMGARRQV